MTVTVLDWLNLPPPGDVLLYYCLWLAYKNYVAGPETFVVEFTIFSVKWNFVVHQEVACGWLDNFVVDRVGPVVDVEIFKVRLDVFVNG